MPATIDLHMHTLYSDGVFSATELLDMVRGCGVVAFAVTDHDTLAGYEEIKGMLKNGDPELIPGVELSVAVGEDDVHVLAYLFDPKNDEMTQALAEFQTRRRERGRQIVEKLVTLGLEIPFGEVERTAGEAVIGRPHIAETMVNLRKVSSYQEAFDRYISRNSPAYVPKVTLEPKVTIDLVHRAGGMTVLAHPFVDDSARHLDMLQHLGLDGIEVYHSSHTPQDVGRLTRMATSRGLVMSGGSDFHGREGRYGSVGSQRVPAELLVRMKQHTTQSWGCR
jgi:3',5'-nucleoside bisphosphate phosphatase